MVALSMLGIGEMIGGIFMGKVVDKLNSRIGVLCNIASIILACSLSLVQIYQNKYNWVSFLFTFSWGFSDGAINTHCN